MLFRKNIQEGLHHSVSWLDLERTRNRTGKKRVEAGETDQSRPLNIAGGELEDSCPTLFPLQRRSVTTGEATGPGAHSQLSLGLLPIPPSLSSPVLSIVPYSLDPSEMCTQEVILITHLTLLLDSLSGKFGLGAINCLHPTSYLFPLVMKQGCSRMKRWAL